MTLGELFRRLSYGELSNLSVGGEGSGDVSEEGRPRLIHFTNDALLRLFSRFILIERSLLVEQVEGVTNYHLRRRFAESTGSNVPHAYIKDLPTEPFEGDVLKILNVYADHGRELALNDIGNPRSLFTPQPDTLQVPHPRGGEVLGIIYQARHPELLAEGRNLEQQEIDLPFFLEPALQSFVAHRVYSSMNGAENSAKGAEHLNAYEAACREVENKDLASASRHTTTTKLDERGFV